MKCPTDQTDLEHQWHGSWQLGSEYCYSQLGLVHSMLGDHEADARCADEMSRLEPTPMSHYRDLLRSLCAVASGRHGEAARRLLGVVQQVRRIPNVLFENDAVVAAAALTHLAGEARHATRLLSVVTRARTPATVQLWLRTRRQVRDSLTREEIEAIRRDAADLTVSQALEEEIRYLEERSRAEV